MSVAGFVNLKQRLSEGGRKMLSSSDRSKPVEVAQEALEVNLAESGCNGTANCGYEDPVSVGVEQLAGKVGATRVSVQPFLEGSGVGQPPLLV